jgi:hypothetical protein
VSIEEIARAEYNALPPEERKRVAYFRNLERIAELIRQKDYEMDRHREALRSLDRTIERTREAMREGREMHA